VKSPKELLTAEEVAEFLRVRPTTVYEWARNGKIPASKIGRLWRFSRQDTESWVCDGSLQA